MASCLTLCLDICLSDICLPGSFNSILFCLILFKRIGTRDMNHDLGFYLWFDNLLYDSALFKINQWPSPTIVSLTYSIVYAPKDSFFSSEKCHLLDGLARLDRPALAHNISPFVESICASVLYRRYSTQQSSSHHHLSLNRESRWGITDDFATSFLHFFLFYTVLWDLPSSWHVHSLMLSSLLFLCLPCLFPPFTVPCKMVLARPDECATIAM